VPQKDRQVVFIGPIAGKVWSVESNLLVRRGVDLLGLLDVRLGTSGIEARGPLARSFSCSLTLHVTS
jgi:hypothetical protein